MYICVCNAITDKQIRRAAKAGVSYPQIEWRKIAGLRDIVAHAYFSIDDEIVWDVISNKLPDLASKIAALKLEFQ